MERKSTQQSPAPEVQRTIIRSRRKSVGDKAQGVVVAVSLAATLLGWGFAAHQDAETAALAAANTAQVIEVSNIVPAVATATVQPTATATPVVSTTQSSTTTTTTTAFTTTKSSR